MTDLSSFQSKIHGRNIDDNKFFYAANSSSLEDLHNAINIKNGVL